MKLAVTGASGLVGKAAVSRFVERGDEVVAIGRSQGLLLQLFSGSADCLETDYCRENLGKAFRGVDAVIHLAGHRIGNIAEGFHQFYAGNLLSTENVLCAAVDCGIKQVCFASSISVYSTRNRIPFKESEPVEPLSLYGVSKLACEALASVYSHKFGIRVTSLRIARILGHDDRTGGEFMLMNFIRLARNKQTLQLWGRGMGARDTIYVKDVVGAIEQAVLQDAPCGVFNIGAGRAFSHREIAETVNEVFDNAGNVEYNTSKQEDSSSFYMDCSRAESELNWHRIWTIKSGLEEMKDLYERKDL